MTLSKTRTEPPVVNATMKCVLGSVFPNTLTKLFLVIFTIYGTSVLYMYNIRSQTTGPRKQTHGVQRNIKYILQWTGQTLAPFGYMGVGTSAFIKNKCKHTNCYVTDDVNFLDQSDFDAIAFNGRDVIKMKISQIPTSRSPKQKYIFAATESSHRFPVCNKMFDNFFNWTWTYKLDSDFRWGYMTIYNTEGQEIGPATDMNWPEKMNPISDDIKLKLSRKSKSAAWFVSNCRTYSRREDFVAAVDIELKKYNWTVDIYGPCGKLKCPKSKRRECEKKVESDYYFYFSFENSFSDDYVTEKLLTALNNYAVPVVFGAANYTRFLPNGSYLDGRKLGPEQLAREMSDLIADKARYYEFFRWRNHFSYVETTETQDICKLCEALNDEQMMKISVWKDFRKWWNGATHKRCRQ